MSAINTTCLPISRNNQQKLNKFISVINDYEKSLNKKVDDIVNHMLTYSKKVSDSVVKLPGIIQPQSATERSKTLLKTINSRKQNSQKYSRGKSISHNFTSFSQISENMEQKINTLKKFVAQSQIQQNINVLGEGRAIGAKKYVKPKYIKKQADIVPREIRLDPFAEKNVIKAQDLQKGLMSLVEKGKIGRDVDIITAFQKGGEILKSRQAIFHHGQQRITKMQQIKQKKIPKQQQQEDFNFSHLLTKKSNLIYDTNNWAITMPEQEFTLQNNTKRSTQEIQHQQFKHQQSLHLKFIHYKPIENSQLKRFFITNLSFGSQIKSIIFEIGQLLHKHCIEIAYVDSYKIIELSTITRKIKKQELIKCILSFKDQSHIKINQIASVFQRKNISINKIQALCKMLMQRNAFQIYLKKKKMQKRLSSWLYNVQIMKNFKQRLENYRQQNVYRYRQLQREFNERYSSIKIQKHYQIHISNKSYEGKTLYKQFLNTQITRIFNFENPSTHIIIILASNLTEQTKNYYYKIMELQDIPNFKDKVTFLHIKNYPLLASNKLSTSQKLYYDSKMMRDIKRRIGNNPAYFRISYPSMANVNLATYYNIPILSGDLIKLMQVENRSNSIERFGLSELVSFRMKPNQYKLLNFSTALIQFCENQKRYRNYVIKINGFYQSRGIGLLTYPFSSLPQIYKNTAFIVNTEHANPSQFYRKLCKHGGIIQAFQQSLSSVVMMGKINHLGEASITATYDKISYGFVNVGYFFPQMTVQNNEILPIFNSVSEILVDMGHFGDFQISLYVDQHYAIYLDKVQCYQTQICSSLFYFKFLCQGNLNSKGQYITKITQTFQTDDNKQEQLVTLQPRSYCYLPYILHFGLSQKQIGSFFQLCRMGGISFDLENKYGSTFILLGSLKNSMGMITTAKDRETCKKLMIKSLEFLIKQNAYNNSKTFVQEKEIRMRQRENILALKERLEDI